MNDTTKLELVAAISLSQLELVQVYLRGLLSAIKLEKLIGKRKAKIVDIFSAEYAHIQRLIVQLAIRHFYYRLK